MVQQIVHIQIGRCGNFIGNAFWSTLGKEHKLTKDGKFTSQLPKNQLLLDKIDVYYEEAAAMRFIPRACLIDLDTDIVDIIKSSSTGQLYKADNLCVGAYGTGGVGAWARGYYTVGADLIFEALDIIRKEVEYCDSIQGFQITHSIASGTGGGMGSLLSMKLRDNYSPQCLSTFSVFPSTKVTHTPYEPYSAILTLSQLIDNCNVVHVMDNEALFNIAHNVLKQKEPKYPDLNFVISMAMSGITAPLRFNCNLNDTLRKMCINLIPFENHHFLFSSQAPLSPSGQQNKTKLTMKELTDQVWSSGDTGNVLAHVEDTGNCLSNTFCFRGEYLSNLVSSSTQYYSRYIDPNIVINSFIRKINTSQFIHIPTSIINLCNKYIPGDACLMRQQYETYLYEFEYEINKIKQKMHMENEFQFKIPNSSKSSLIKVPLFSGGSSILQSCTMLSNSTSIKRVFNRISGKFAGLYKIKASLNVYKGEGMDEMEFIEADKNVRDLITGYQDQQDAFIDYGDNTDYSDDDCDSEEYYDSDDD